MGLRHRQGDSALHRGTGPFSEGKQQSERGAGTAPNLAPSLNRWGNAGLGRGGAFRPITWAWLELRNPAPDLWLNLGVLPFSSIRVTVTR